MVGQIWDENRVCRMRNQAVFRQRRLYQNNKQVCKMYTYTIVKHAVVLTILCRLIPLILVRKLMLGR